MDIIQRLKAEAKAGLKSSLASIDRSASTYRKGDVFQKKVKDAFPGCDVDISCSYGTATVRLYLTKEYNITKDVNMLLDKEAVFVDFLLDGAELKAADYAGTSYDIKLGSVSFEVYYRGGNCTRVKIREDLVMQPIYEVVCN